jgi:hypothetical protein
MGLEDGEGAGRTSKKSAQSVQLGIFRDRSNSRSADTTASSGVEASATVISPCKHLHGIPYGLNKVL